MMMKPCMRGEISRLKTVDMEGVFSLSLSSILLSVSPFPSFFCSSYIIIAATKAMAQRRKIIHFFASMLSLKMCESNDQHCHLNCDRQKLSKKIIRKYYSCLIQHIKLVTKFELWEKPSVTNRFSSSIYGNNLFSKSCM